MCSLPQGVGSFDGYTLKFIMELFIIKDIVVYFTKNLKGLKDMVI